MEKQTAGRDALGKFAPKFAQLNDDVLFGEVWSREDRLSLHDRSIITITALISSGVIDSSLQYHLKTGKKNGITKNEIAEILTHLSFYAGWPKVWAAFRAAKDIWTDEKSDSSEKDEYEKNLLFPVGKPNDAFARYFVGQSYLSPVSDEQVGIYNVTFEPACRNNWHIHRASQGGGQILLCISGNGWYQEYGKQARALHSGDVVNIKPNVKHWHGAKKDSWFSHLAVEVPGENCATEWLEAVDENEYYSL